METVGVPETDLSVTNFKFLDVIEAKYFTVIFVFHYRLPFKELWDYLIG